MAESESTITLLASMVENLETVMHSLASETFQLPHALELNHKDRASLHRLALHAATISGSVDTLLARAHDAVAFFENSVRVKTAPITVLPQELLREIISYTDPTNYAGIDILSRVSSQMRAAVFSCQRLFTCPRWEHWSPPVIELWCSRAGARGLTVKLGKGLRHSRLVLSLEALDPDGTETRPADLAWDPAYLVRVMDATRPQWQHLDLHEGGTLSSSQTRLLTSFLFRTPLISLQDFNLSATFEDDTDGASAFNAPNVKTLSFLQSVPPRFFSNSLPQLLSIRVHLPDEIESGKTVFGANWTGGIWNAGSNIENLDLEVHSGVRIDDEATFSSISCVKSLSVDVTSKLHIITQLLSKVSFANLQRFTIQNQASGGFQKGEVSQLLQNVSLFTPSATHLVFRFPLASFLRTANSIILNLCNLNFIPKMKTLEFQVDGNEEDSEKLDALIAAKSSLTKFELVLGNLLARRKLERVCIPVSSRIFSSDLRRRRVQLEVGLGLYGEEPVEETCAPPITEGSCDEGDGASEGEDTSSFISFDGDSYLSDIFG
ncbi:hypothetical protein DL93DRAFT_2098583 [Clavulina sp. PMI_390]|nr:hypothetical protein DL93DRAFT_2098583 [Clavulina sp. PMI_390]